MTDEEIIANGLSPPMRDQIPLKGTVKVNNRICPKEEIVLRDNGGYFPAHIPPHAVSYNII